MVKLWHRLICWLGFHDYRYIRAGYGSTMYRCVYCGYNPHLGV